MLKPPTINPYKVGPPVTGTDFYGRNDLLYKVSQALIPDNVVLLQGQRRIGKTSFLQQLSKFLISETVETRNLDIQRYVQDTLPQFQEHLAKTIAKDVQLPVPSLSEWESNRTLFFDIWLPEVFERLSSRELVIIVDEFDNLGEQTENRATEALVPFIGKLVASEQRLKWVFTVGRHNGKLPIQYDPIVSRAAKYPISFLSAEETRQLIVKPASEILTYQETAVERIYQLTNGQPHLTQALCSEVFERVVFEESREIATVEDVDAVIPHTLQAYAGAIASIARVPILQERVLAAVAQLTGEGKTTSRDQIINLLLENRVRLERDELTDTLFRLLEWELLTGDAQGVRVAIQLVQIWLTKNVSLEPSREEELDIHYALAQNRYEFAEKVRQVGKYEIAIKDYQEALEHIPNHCSALRGLAEAYRLSGDLAGRATALQKLYFHERNILPELVEALADYAQQSEEKGKFSVAAEQYETLSKLQNRDCWRQGLVQSLIKEFEKCLKQAEENLDSKETELDKLLKLSKLQSSLVKAKQNIERGLAVMSDSPESEELKQFLKTIERREWIVLTRFKVEYAKLQEKWKEVTRLLIALEKAGVELKIKYINDEYFNFLIHRNPKTKFILYIAIALLVIILVNFIQIIINSYNKSIIIQINKNLSFLVYIFALTIIQPIIILYISYLLLTIIKNLEKHYAYLWYGIARLIAKISFKR